MSQPPSAEDSFAAACHCWRSVRGALLRGATVEASVRAEMAAMRARHKREHKAMWIRIRQLQKKRRGLTEKITSATRQRAELERRVQELRVQRDGGDRRPRGELDELIEELQGWS